MIRVVLLAVSLSGAGIARAASAVEVYRFEYVQGPSGKTTPAPPRPAADAEYRSGGNSRLAILLTDPDSSWLGLVHGFKAIGLPFCITRDYREALRHRVVLVYPTISGQVLPPEALAALARFPEQGGTLMAVDVEGGGLQGVFGFSRIVPSRARSQIKLDASNPMARGLDDERERVFPFTNSKLGDQAMGSVGYVDAQEPPLALFEDGTAAITSRRVGKGRAFAFGVDPGFLLLTGYNNREQGIARAYADEFEPALDVLLRLVQNIYRAGEPAAATLYTVPQGKRLSVVISHDIDYSSSVVNAVSYAEYERNAGFRATYFMQTKYVRDWNDDVFFNARGVADLIKVRALGAEVASHSVSHSRMFARFPMGTGDEQYPGYQPFVKNRTLTVDGTILGELRVSRFLLQRMIPRLVVRSFRPGHLENPYELPQALEAVGYRYSSSVTANNSLTHLPFRLNYGRANKAESAIYEFPIAIEDEQLPPLQERLPAALALAGKLSRYGALMVVLIHTNVVEPKLGFERGLVDALKSRAWFGALEDFGSFWTARDQVEVDAEAEGSRVQVRLRAPWKISGLTLCPPAGYRLVSARPAGLTVREVEGRLVIADLKGEATLTLTAR